MATGYVFHPACVEHDPGPGHPERPQRLTAVDRHLRSLGLIADCAERSPRAATRDELERVHGPDHVEHVLATAGRPPAQLDADTAVGPGSAEAALRAAGSVLEAVEQVLAGEWNNAFCAVRPPGHHAERDRAMGFCLFNNVAVAAAALRAGGVERVAVVDWDVHHGNGTQHAFEEDPRVFYASLHQWPLYPGTGSEAERGRGEGEGATLNVCLPPRTAPAAWLAAFEDRVLPALEAFRPQFLLVSAGFDAHAADPLAQLELDEATFARATGWLCDLAARHAGGRLVSVLEGGYDTAALAACAAAHLSALREAPCA